MPIEQDEQQAAPTTGSDPYKDYLDKVNVSPEAKGAAWSALNDYDDRDSVKKALDAAPIPTQNKRDLWELKFPSPKVAASSSPAGAPKVPQVADTIAQRTNEAPGTAAQVAPITQQQPIESSFTDKLLGSLGFGSDNAALPPHPPAPPAPVAAPPQPTAAPAPIVPPPVPQPTPAGLAGPPDQPVSMRSLATPAPVQPDSAAKHVALKSIYGAITAPSELDEIKLQHADAPFMRQAEEQFNQGNSQYNAPVDPLRGEVRSRKATTGEKIKEALPDPIREQWNIVSRNADEAAAMAHRAAPAMKEAAATVLGRPDQLAYMFSRQDGDPEQISDAYRELLKQNDPEYATRNPLSVKSMTENAMLGTINFAADQSTLGNMAIAGVLGTAPTTFMGDIAHKGANIYFALESGKAAVTGGVEGAQKLAKGDKAGAISSFTEGVLSAAFAYHMAKAVGDVNLTKRAQQRFENELTDFVYARGTVHDANGNPVVVTNKGDARDIARQMIFNKYGGDVDYHNLSTGEKGTEKGGPTLRESLAGEQQYRNANKTVRPLENMGEAERTPEPKQLQADNTVPEEMPHPDDIAKPSIVPEQGEPQAAAPPIAEPEAQPEMVPEQGEPEMPHPDDIVREPEPQPEPQPEPAPEPKPVPAPEPEPTPEPTPEPEKPKAEVTVVPKPEHRSIEEIEHDLDAAVESGDRAREKILMKELMGAHKAGAPQKRVATEPPETDKQKEPPEIDKDAEEEEMPHPDDLAKKPEVAAKPPTFPQKHGFHDRVQLEDGRIGIVVGHWSKDGYKVRALGPKGPENVLTYEHKIKGVSKAPADFESENVDEQLKKQASAPQPEVAKPEPKSNELLNGEHHRIVKLMSGKYAIISKESGNMTHVFGGDEYDAAAKKFHEIEAKKKAETPEAEPPHPDTIKKPKIEAAKPAPKPETTAKGKPPRLSDDELDDLIGSFGSSELRAPDDNERMRRYMGDTASGDTNTHTQAQNELFPGRKYDELTRQEQTRVTARSVELNQKRSAARQASAGQAAQKNFAYRSRDVGEDGVPIKNAHSQATLSQNEAESYMEGRENVNGKEQELVRIDLSKLNPSDYTVMEGPRGNKWVKFNRELPESMVQPVTQQSGQGSSALAAPKVTGADLVKLGKLAGELYRRGLTDKTALFDKVHAMVVKGAGLPMADALRDRLDDEFYNDLKETYDEPESGKPEVPNTEGQHRPSDEPTGTEEVPATKEGEQAGGGGDEKGEPPVAGDRGLDEHRDEPDASDVPDGSGDGPRPGDVEKPNVDLEALRKQIAEENAKTWFYHAKEALAQGGEVGRTQATVKMLQVFKTLAEENRLATPEEKAAISLFNGWGSIRNSFNKWSPNGKRFAEELEKLLGEDAFYSAKGASQYQFLTRPHLVENMWKWAQKMGFSGGRILEPSMGTGYFFGLAPKEIIGHIDTQLTGVEKDDFTAAIAKTLWGDNNKANIIHAPYQEVHIPNSNFDLALGNVPFSETTIRTDPNYKLGMNLHDYFIAKTLDKIRPGGIAMLITSAGTLDKADPSARKFFSERADLLAAFRFPAEMFQQNAGTEVTTDMLIFRKRAPGMVRGGQEFLNVGDSEIPSGRAAGKTLPMNEYYATHPEHVMGDMVPSQRHGENDNKISVELQGDLDEAINKFIEHVPENVFQEGITSQGEAEHSVGAQRGSGFHSIASNGDIMVRNATGQIVPLEKQYPEKAKNPDIVNRLRALVPLAEHYQDFLNLQLATPISADEALVEGRTKLNKLYDDYRDKFKSYMNDPKTAAAMEGDPRYYQLLAMEQLDEDYEPIKKKDPKQKFDKADVFTKRTVWPRQDPTILKDDPRSWLAASYVTKGSLDADYLSKALGIPKAEIENKLVETGLAFHNPAERGVIPTDQYLSGNVRIKLAEAEAAAKSDQRFASNVAELKKVQPEKIAIENITIRPGNSYITPEEYTTWAQKLFKNNKFQIERKGDGKYVVTGQWKKGDRYAIESQWAVTDKEGNILKDGIDLLRAAMMGRVGIPISVYDPATHKEVFDPVATNVAHEKLKQMRAELEKWARTGPEKDVIEHRYNQNNNAIALRNFDGQHLGSQVPLLDTQTGEQRLDREGKPMYGIRLSGMNPSWSLYPFQANAVWRGIVEGRAGFFHEVGMGKTIVMFSTAMEMKRLGIARKSLMTTPNSISDQFAMMGQMMFPGAKILHLSSKELPSAPTEEEIKANPGGTKLNRLVRKRTLAMMQSGDWDVVVIPHSVMEMLRVSPEYEMKTLNGLIDEMRQSLDAANEQKADKRTIAEMEKRIEAWRERIAELAAKGRDEDTLYFDQTGADYIHNDEAHAVKNAPIASSMGQIEHLPTSGKQSARAVNMLAITNYLNEVNNNRGVFFATGTPIVNTMAELYNMTRFIAPNVLKEANIRTFDEWASTFGSVNRTWGLKPDGSGFRAKDKFDAFINVPELSQMVRHFADVARVSMNPDVVKTPSVEYTFQDVEATDEQTKEMEKVVRRLAHMPKDRSLDNPLKAMMDSSKIAIDLALQDHEWQPEAMVARMNEKLHEMRTQVKEMKTALNIDSPGRNTAMTFDWARTVLRKHEADPTSVTSGDWNSLHNLIGGAEKIDDLKNLIALHEAAARLRNERNDFANKEVLSGKIPALAANIARLYHVGENERGMPVAQVVFADIFRNRETKEIEKKQKDGTMKTVKKKGKELHNIFKDVARMLTEHYGIPADEIAIIHDYNGKSQKATDKRAALFDKVRKGVVRVLCATTEKGGTGVNLQTRLFAVHHLDVPWTPMKFEQRDGRIVRQGNLLTGTAKSITEKDVHVIHYGIKPKADIKRAFGPMSDENPAARRGLDLYRQTQPSNVHGVFAGRNMPEKTKFSDQPVRGNTPLAGFKVPSKFVEGHAVRNRGTNLVDQARAAANTFPMPWLDFNRLPLNRRGEPLMETIKKFPRSADAYRLQKVTNKRTMQKQFWDGQMNDRTIQDMAGEVLLDGKTQMAIMMGDETAMEKVQAEEALGSLKAMQANWYDAKRKFKDDKQFENNAIERKTREIGRYKQLGESYRETKDGKGPLAVVDGKSFADRGELLQYLNNKYPINTPLPAHGLSFYGVPVLIRYNSGHAWSESQKKTVAGMWEYEFAGDWHEAPTTGAGLLQSFENRARSAESKVAEYEGQIEQHKKNIADLDKRVNEKSPYLEEIAKQEKELRAINAELGIIDDLAPTDLGAQDHDPNKEPEPEDTDDDDDGDGDSGLRAPSSGSSALMEPSGDEEGRPYGDMYDDEEEPTDRGDELAHEPGASGFRDYGYPKLPMPQPGVAGEQTNKIDVVNAIRDLRKMITGHRATVKTGGAKQLGSNALGLWYHTSEGIRLKYSEDIPVLAHEASHDLNKLVFGKHSPRNHAPNVRDLKPFRTELLPIATAKPTDPLNIKLMEGFAEFGRLFLTDPAKAQQYAPSFFKFYENKLATDFPKVLEQSRKVQAMVKDYVHQGSVEAVMGNISFDPKDNEPEFSLEKKADQVYSRWIDDLHFLKVATETMGAHTALGVEPVGRANPATVARVSRAHAAMSREFIEHGAIDFNNRDTRTSKGLPEIWKDAGIKSKKDRKFFSAYLVAQHVPELEARKIKTGMEVSDARNTVRQLDATYPGFADAAKEFRKLATGVFQYGVDSGLYSQDDMDRAQKMNLLYTPMARLMDEGYNAMNKGHRGGGSNRFGNAGKPIKRQKGSGRTVIDPQETIMKMIHLTVANAERNWTMVTLADLASTSEGSSRWMMKRERKSLPTELSIAEIIDQLKREAKQKGIDLGDLPTTDIDVLAKMHATIFRPEQPHAANGEIYLYRKGKPEFWQIADPDLYRELSGLDAVTSHAVVKIFSAATRGVRAGATILSGRFGPRHIIRMSLVGPIQSNNGLMPWHVLGALASSFKKDALFHEFMAAGGGMGAPFVMERGELRKSLDQMYDVYNNPAKYYLKPNNWLKLVAKSSEISDLAPRLAEFKRSKQAGNDSTQAAIDARNAFADAQRAGSTARTWNQFEPFTNIKLQHLDAFLRTMVKHPARWSLWGAGIAAFSAALYMLNRDDPNYQEIPQWRKDAAWNVPTDVAVRMFGEKAREQADHGFVMVPKPFTYGLVFGSGTERMMNYIDKKDPKAFDGYRDSFMKETFPEFHMVPNTPIPFPATALTDPLIEAASNRNFLTGRPVEFPYSQRFAPHDRRYPNTTAWAIGMSQALYHLGQFNHAPNEDSSMDYSPIMIQHLFERYGGGLAIDGDKIFNLAANAYHDGKFTGPSTMADVPVVGAFFSRNPDPSSESVQNFYGELKFLADKADAQKASRGDKSKISNPMTDAEHYRLGQLKLVSGQINAAHNTMRQAQDNKNLTSTQRENIVNLQQKRIIRLAREIEQKRPKEKVAK